MTSPDGDSGLASRYRRLFLTLAAGTVGGTIFFFLQAPLPWMLGALVATMLVSMAGVRTHMQQNFRRIWAIVLGVMLGSSFTPEVVAHMHEWLVSFVGMLVFIALASFLAFQFYRRVGMIDSRTAFFCASPGGLGEMAIMGPAMGADERTIVLTHAVRIVLVMFIIPPAYTLIAGYVPPPDLGVGVHVLEMDPADAALLTAIGVVGAIGARLLRLPAWQIVGPMVLSAVVHGAGLTTARPPTEFVAAAQVVIGAGAGARFSGVKPHELLRPALLSGIVTICVLALALVAALGVAAITGIDFRAIHLAYSPGGFAEMSLIALALGIEVPFVSLHHMGRIFFVVTAASLLAKLIWDAASPAAMSPPDPGDRPSHTP